MLRGHYRMELQHDIAMGDGTVALITPLASHPERMLTMQHGVQLAEMHPLDVS